jgi:hypothetical protein
LPVGCVSPGAGAGCGVREEAQVLPANVNTLLESRLLRWSKELSFAKREINQEYNPVNPSAAA